MSVNDNLRIQITITGAVQGVGFRPYIYRLAKSLSICGSVSNTSAGVVIEAQAPQIMLERFIHKIPIEKPQIAIINSLNYKYIEPNFDSDFIIITSEHSLSKSALILPDLAICQDCLTEINDSNNRRSLYPFTNCTNCGPRYSIIESLPYDRKNTTMNVFEMCEDCLSEYNNPEDRRFHAQPNACPKCGPVATLYDKDRNLIARNEDSFTQASELLSQGKILAFKSIGGYQLMVDASNTTAVNKLRRRKKRSEKPFAVMFPNINQLKEMCYIDENEEKELKSQSSPIGIVKIKDISSHIAKNSAPENPYLGAILPYTPMHFILFKYYPYPVIATSGNISEEPIAISDEVAFDTLGEIADYFLAHNREIARRVDDSIVRFVLGKRMVLRRARGFAPLPVMIDNPENRTIISAGAFLKNSITLLKGNSAFISQHIGDLSNISAINFQQECIEDLTQMYEANPEILAKDLHPDISQELNKKSKIPIEYIQHHYAHIAGCRGEHNIIGDVLGIAFDGTGYGEDGTIWGGEFILSSNNSYKRIGTFNNFLLLGGDFAIKQPKRIAYSLMRQVFQQDFDSIIQNHFQQKFSNDELEAYNTMWEKSINANKTSSVGRLFDGISSILGLRDEINYEAQAAMKLEFIADESEKSSYSFSIIDNDLKIIKWNNIILEILEDLNNNIPKSIISAKFHNTLVEIISDMALNIKIEQIVLSGGCFQNKILLEKTYLKLTSLGFKVFFNQDIPINDGGISFGQSVIASNR